jgi:GNAT superfamily N-acetyltransferase
VSFVSNTKNVRGKKTEIKEVAADELKKAFPIVRQLRTHLTVDDYIELTQSMMADGYRIFCLFDDGEIVSYAGIAILTNLYYGKHIWVYELVTDETKRGKGYGKRLLSYLEKYGKDNALNCIALSSGLQREDAHRFYEDSMGYEKASYVFKKNLL